MKKVLEITKVSQQQYNELLLESFFFWAGKNTFTKTQYQVVVCDKAIKKWFFIEYDKLNNEFVSFIDRHPNASTKDNERLYARMIGKIYEIYPKVLLDDIKKKYNGIPMHNLN